MIKSIKFDGKFKSNTVEIEYSIIGDDVDEITNASKDIIYKTHEMMLSEEEVKNE